MNRRTAIKTGLLTAAASAMGLNSARAQGTSKAAPVLMIQGEAATRANIPVVRDRRASGGRYLALATKKRPGRRRITSASAEATVSRDPVYVVTATAGRPEAHAAPRRRTPLSPAEHIVLSQRYAARNAAPNKDNGDAEPPLGYRLSRRTRMSLDVYNFPSTSRTVTVKAPRPAGGWSARAEGPTRVEVPPQGRMTVDFVITAGSGVERRTDHRPQFTATLDGDEVPPSVSLVQLK